MAKYEGMDSKETADMLKLFMKYSLSTYPEMKEGMTMWEAMKERATKEVKKQP